ncbi:hypothetical protein DEF23_13305 [Marinitenerispora sediminis]|uniref:Uncharacterized protein n=2 Tax=Marinitenerispora sediminis TaxID=1931232 RepID=A0A368T154_9ACTN|nr:hypothetical protein DEF28_12300 [Marinitenerispora sediminis]RCV53695.1 hypothetical protein DEF24_20280 [Marinitenerispora sediminis]RCV56081.1 hypothetical protein DEF23_13305 [Marinitenerispora sediminis]
MSQMRDNERRLEAQLGRRLTKDEKRRARGVDVTLDALQHGQKDAFGEEIPGAQTSRDRKQIGRLKGSQGRSSEVSSRSVPQKPKRRGLFG